ncbi:MULTISPECIES: RHS repeat-associated core domain-containing protein [unclassified Janthinobacterium]|uniref:RHS repeat-associated core domain-containing protein n=1 Tax=unclassified Janthinobacterium TaxID=2610881 RepID=UPI0012FC22F7|nr:MULTISPECIES: RHS repeat-associated core domain-containing protein [unclassified Janthinobacterium]MEC5159546.1 RHS repeat-associated protein [Janthinobacterium sp. CG_S6]
MRYTLRPTGMLLALACAGGVQAQGNTTFGQAPAIAYDEAAPGERAGKAGSAGAGTQQPGYSRAIMAPVSPAQSEQAIWARTPARMNLGVAPQAARPKSGAKGTLGTLRIGGDAAPAGPASIPELARALRGNPDLIYEYVRNNIEYVPTWGHLKGGYGALLDNQGTAFDQAALMIALLRQSGYTASFVKGRVNLTAAQVHDWLGVDTSKVCAVLNLMGSAQIPVASVTATAAGSCPGSTAALHSMKFDHVWVKVNIGGTFYYFDPSYKAHTFKPGINVAAAAGYNASGFLSGATTGAVVTADYVQGLNRGNVRGNLTNYANNLATHLRANYPAGTLDDVVGGMSIVPHAGNALRQASLPYQDTTVALTEWSADVPANYKPTLRVQYQGIDSTFSSDAIYGRRLSISYNASNQPVLSLDGAALATGTATTPGTYGTVSFVVTHGAYAQTFANQSFTQQIKAGGTFLIGNGWGPAGRGPVDLHRGRLDEALAAGAAAGSEAVLGSTLAVLSSSWLGQVNHSTYITDRLAKTNTLFHHQVGIAGYNTAAFVDLPGNMLSVVSQEGNVGKEAAVFFSSSMYSSIFESTAVQQTTGGSAVSTVKLIDQAVAANDKIFDGTAANFASAVQPNLVGCASWLAGFQSAVAAGRRLILPARCNLTEGSWTGAGYFSVLVNASGSSIGAIIGGGMAGGFSTSPLAPATTAGNTLINSVSPFTLKPATGSAWGDPIDMTKGHYLHLQSDLTTGVDEFPLSLKFARTYTSGNRTQDGALGKGWSSNMFASVAVGSDGFQGMGEDSALDAVGAIAAKLVSLDLMTDTAKPLTNMVLATLSQRWFGEQIINNTVVVKQGLNGEVFVKLPGGQFNSPQGNAAKLGVNVDGTYFYETLNKAVLSYDSAGKLATYTHPAGIAVRYGYSGGLLTQVSNSVGRSLTITHVGGRVSSVSDGARTVNFTYDGSGNLATSKDAMSQTTTYQYDLPGRLTKVFYPANPTLAALTNVYDTLGRVQTQTNVHGKLYDYYFAGSRSEEVGPYGQSRVSYLDAQGKILKSVDPLGRVDVTTYDGHSRPTRTVMPEGNAIEYVYDDAPCAAQLRCSHNVKTVRHLPKPGSGLPILSDSMSYESAFNKLASATDAMLRTTSYTYTAQGNPLTVTSPADSLGQQPTTTFAYTAFTAAGFPPFYLQTSDTSKISASATVLRTTAYNASNKYVQQSVTTDAGTGQLNLTTTSTYDGVGNLTLVDGPRADVSDTVAIAYNANRQPIQVTDALGKMARSVYDADGRKVRSATQVGPQWLVACHSYSASGKVLKNWGPATMASDAACPVAAAPLSVTDYSYDDLDRNVRVVENLTAAEGGNRITDTAYFLDNKVQLVSRAVGTALAQQYARYTYTPNGQIATITDAKNNLTTHVYDGHERKLKTMYPDKVTAGVSSATDVEQFAYNNAGNLTSYVKRGGETVAVGYDNLGRVLSRSYPNAAENVQFSYDLLSRQTSARYANGSFDISSVFDNASRLTSVNAGGKVLAYLYDAAGNRVRTTWPDATPFYVSTDYDALNRPTAIKEMGGVALATYGYDDLSRRATLTFGNGTSTTYGYNTQGGLASVAQNLGGTAQDNTWTFTRNQVQDLAGHSWSNDIYQWSGFTNGSRNYTANGLNQYTAAAGAAIAHDANGNLSGTGVWTYAYDGDNRLKSASKTGLAATLAYDALGRLRQSVIGAGTKNFLYSGSLMVGEYDAAGNLLQRYVHGAGADEPLVRYQGATTANKSWLYADHLGSIVANADSAGTASATMAYGPFGEAAASNDVRFGYTGQLHFGELGLSYYKARFYSPAMGRFLQTDPVGTVDGLNLYAYVGNNPANRTDPSGAVAETVWDIANLVMGGASLAYNIKQGHYGWAAVDAVGLVYDGIATGVPFLPAGASAGLKAYRAGVGVKNAVTVGTDVAHVAAVAHPIAKAASTTTRAATEGTQIHRATGAAVDLSENARNFLPGANRASGIQPDVSWANAPGVWADLTTAGQWGAHVRKYGASFGEGIPLLYERGKGMIDTLRIRPGAGVGLTAIESGYLGVCQ